MDWFVVMLGATFVAGLAHQLLGLTPPPVCRDELDDEVEKHW